MHSPPDDEVLRYLKGPVIMGGEVGRIEAHAAHRTQGSKERLRYFVLYLLVGKTQVLQ